MCIGLHVEQQAYPLFLPDFNETWIQIFEKYISDVIKIRSVGAECVIVRIATGLKTETEEMSKTTQVFVSFISMISPPQFSCNKPKTFT